jgi:hypothetical protein
MSIGEFDGSLVSGGRRSWFCPSSFSFQFFYRFWSTEEGMDSFGLFLELNQVGSGMWQMARPTPAAEDGRGDIDLRPANVTYGTDQAGRVVKTTYRLVVLGAKAPQVATLAQVLWAGMVEMVFDLVVRRERGRVSTRCSSVFVVLSAGVPFCRCNYSFRRVFPIFAPLFWSVCIDQGVSDGCVAVL